MKEQRFQILMMHSVGQADTLSTYLFSSHSFQELRQFVESETKNGRRRSPKAVSEFILEKMCGLFGNIRVNQ